MRFAAMLFWLLVPVGLWGTYLLHGLPHLVWNYTFEDNGDPHNPLAERYYIDCTFWGPYGRFKIPAEGRRCGWVMFFKDNSAQ